MRFIQHLKNVSYSKKWIGIFLVFGLFLLITGTERYQVIIGLVSIGMAGYQTYRYFKMRPKDKKSTKTPMDYLKERYAKGEITRDEFNFMKQDLEE